jgi:hypothetical protein
MADLSFHWIYISFFLVSVLSGCHFHMIWIWCFLFSFAESAVFLGRLNKHYVSVLFLLMNNTRDPPLQYSSVFYNRKEKFYTYQSVGGWGSGSYYIIHCMQKTLSFKDYQLGGPDHTDVSEKCPIWKNKCTIQNIVHYAILRFMATMTR